MVKSFKEWFDAVGYMTYDEISEYLENNPDSIDIQGDLGIFDIDECAYCKCEELYESYVSDYNDLRYDEWKDGFDV